MIQQYLIIEDEDAAARRLHKMLQQLLPQATCVAILPSIQKSVQWLQQHQHPDVIFMDIHLADGSSFEIPKQVSIQSPIIFTTAYDQYALEAFKLNSIDYILKPATLNDIELALNKLERLQHHSIAQQALAQLVAKLSPTPKPAYKERFVVKIGEQLKTVETQQIAYIFTEHKTSIAILFDGKKMPLDACLDELETQLHPQFFFRANRQFIVNYKAIAQMHTYTKSRIIITLQPPAPEEVVVSSEKSAAFKDWLAGN
jgi:DNA-binding LytR/AlgR family response regulator